MKRILTFIAAGLSLAAFASGQQQRRYRVIDLSTLGGAYSFGFSISDAGEVAGTAPLQPNGFAVSGYVGEDSLI